MDNQCQRANGVHDLGDSGRPSEGNLHPQVLHSLPGDDIGVQHDLISAEGSKQIDSSIHSTLRALVHCPQSEGAKTVRFSWWWHKRAERRWLTTTAWTSGKS
eukprot:jgi/Ulvmu1/6919/UM031_0127.1